jgi:beta-galactosidase/beta-glucuronidase
MFACGQYPCHRSFRESVEKEARQQVQRLRVHPSMVLFAGNNEDYQIAEFAGLKWDPEEVDPEKWLKSDFPARYLYEKVFPDVLRFHGAGIAYHPGSPWGKGKPTRDPTVGDIHQWNGTPPQNVVDDSLAWKSGTVPIIPRTRRPLRFRIRNASPPIPTDTQTLSHRSHGTVPAIPDHGSSQ